ncbi:cupin domain-containing protein [Pseudonocardia adelaidensis]|uniref:Cupin domain-containing protein n=1 Tax=Pseudonocardia adelaidensis TaxID=648754 RepID=A0ABP9NP71_9PSEU
MPAESVRFTRITRTDEGGSVFEDDEIRLAERHVVDGVPPMAVAGVPATGGVVVVRSAAFDSAPHPAPREQWVVMLRGVIEVRVTGGATRRFGPGDLVLAADTTGAGHVTVGAGDPPFEALFVPASPGRTA